ncbi:MAG TPA: Hint domain-containing protein, partial [Gammaproteobacteria bacterium]|nr:Hint domain-containing protein [Gammaproteobacteria bacterium]
MSESEDRIAGLTANDLRDQWTRLNVLYKGVDRDGKVFDFRPNWAQKDLYRLMWYRNVILKARQIGFCLDPSTRVLTAELQWVQIADLEPGQQIVSVDEYPPGGRGRARKMRTATVQGVVEVYRKAYRITFDDGRSVVCTGKH